MKKRAMKKWIPKGTCYCYTYDKKGRHNPYKWHRTSSKHHKQQNGYCMYLCEGDWQSEGMSLLWDMCKECSHKYD
ncbi:hypothetical protein N496_18690 (plasmid) [Clostridium botulinum A2B3 87]|uniref:hypothetical protein n=1 Tax=Clostridium botulinum TaxID=1491 RepID=UPI0004A56D78|nr:hypothetical protein [Clostridium botulinum]KEI94999.1 hypothetical protein N496_18690 [Clostridium botulinum A2B3 87]